VSHYSHVPNCICKFCERDRIQAAEARQRIKRFDALMAEIQSLRQSRAAAIEHRDRAEFDGFRALASALSLTDKAK
jgi:hypothetical protein